MKLNQKLERKKKEHGIYLIRRLDCNLKGQPHSYCVSIMKKADRSFVEVVKDFDDYLRGCMPEDSQLEYADRMFVVHADDITYYFCLEAYKKCADSRGYMEEGIPQTELMHRMGVEQAIRRIKRYSNRYWRKTRVWISPEEAIDEIKKQMADPEQAERYPNHADRFVAGYNAWKRQRKRDPDYIKGVL